ncbi:MAG: vanadium-dependent haloperoxidase [Candidatus Manganitrophus sp.]|nr:vanadium-dependent haloperoxidase [Candidatus Manganitrophus sp.]WDT69714.1 MAG: vanadium-dependent haloperoxidase [Candidatus Manganitrophus sp.]
MIVKQNWKWMIPILVILAVAMTGSVWARGSAGDFDDAWGRRFDDQSQFRDSSRDQTTRNGNDAINRLRYWNEIAINTSGLDHTPVAPGESRVFGEQLGPGRSSRALAIVQIGVFDAINAIVGGYRSYTGLSPVSSSTSIDAAIAQAAHDTLIALFPSQKARLDGLLAEDLSQIRTSDGRAKTNGINLGKRAAAAILTLRANDHSHYIEPQMDTEYIPSNEPGKWRQDPISQIPIAMGAYWGKVTPFVLTSGSQFRVPPPPAMDSPEYTAAFEEVKRLGGDGVVTPTERTTAETEIGIYWAYDGTPSLCAPPRLYNQIAVQIAEQMGSNTIELARLLALVNVAMADAGVAIWESKFYYNVWRPVTGIREADEGTGPTGLGDGNPATVGDPEFTPLGAPASNLTGPDFTPLPGLSFRACRVRGRPFSSLEELLPDRQYSLHLRVGRVQRRDAGQRRKRPPAPPAQLLDPLPGRGRERTEPNLSRYPLVVRQNRRDYPGPARGRFCVQERLRAGARAK